MQVVILSRVAFLQFLALLVGIVIDHIPDQVQPDSNLYRICGEFAFLLLSALIVQRKGFGLSRDANVLAGITTMKEQILALDLRVNDALVENKDLRAIAALQLVIEHLELVHLPEFALIVDVEL